MGEIVAGLASKGGIKALAPADKVEARTAVPRAALAWLIGDAKDSEMSKENSNISIFEGERGSTHWGSKIIY